MRKVMYLIDSFLSVSTILFGSVIIPKRYNTEYIKWIVLPFNSKWNWMWRWKFSLENKSHTQEYSHQPKIIRHFIVYFKLTYSIIMNSDSLFPFHLRSIILNPSVTTGPEWDEKKKWNEREPNGSEQFKENANLTIVNQKWNLFTLLFFHLNQFRRYRYRHKTLSK